MSGALEEQLTPSISPRCIITSGAISAGLWAIILWQVAVLGGVDKLPRGELSKCLRDI